ncbi:MAG: hypothetical protein ABIQ59_04660 [Nocardioidaceae bacterium]
MSRFVVVLLVLVAGCTTSPSEPAEPDRGPVGPATRTPSSTETFDCGTVDLRRMRAPERSRRLALVDGCLHNALLDGQPARTVRVSGAGGSTLRTTYVVTGRGQLAISARQGEQVRLRRCTNASSLFELGTCTRDPGPGM